MIDQITFKFGSSISEPRLQVDLTPVTIFVGPNNSGKSRCLVELESYCRQTHGQENDCIINRLAFTPFSQDEIEAEVLKLEQLPNTGELVNLGHVLIGKLNPQNNQAFRTQVHKENLIKEWEDLISLKENGFNSGNISEVCRCIRKTAGGFKWKFKTV